MLVTINVRLLLMMMTVVLFTLSACGREDYEEVKKGVETTDLSTESLGGISLGMSLDEDNTLAGHGYFEPHPDNAYYAPRRNNDQYWNGQVIFSVVRETREILQISTLEDNTTSSSSKGMTVGKTLDDVIVAYGENYYTYDDKEQTIYIIGYIDHKMNYELIFRDFNGEVTGVSLKYAFDRLKWEES